MKQEKMTRKKFLTDASRWSLTAVVGGGLLSACAGPSGESEQQTESTIPPPVEEESGMDNPEALGNETEACNDLTGLSEVEIQQREQLQYVAQSPKEEQICANCRFWQPEAYDNPCGGCQLLKGPVNPNGWCQTWAPMQT